MVTNRVTSADFLFGLLIAALISTGSSTAPVYAQGYPPPGYAAPAPAYPPAMFRS